MCGDDRYSGKNFDHRKTWVVERLRFLATIFCIDVCAYAVMSNHLHLILRLMTERAQQLSAQQVAARYCQVFPGGKLQLQALPETEQGALIEVWRERLCNISWMMRALNEWVARRANQEDGCTGRFWEGRCKSKALLDDRGLLTCMAYVDLNPYRAGMTDSLEASDFTSIQARLQDRASQVNAGGQGQNKSTLAIVGLSPLADDKGTRHSDRLPIDFAAYLELLCWTAAAQRASGDKKRSKPPALLERFGLCADAWVRSMRQHQLETCTALGSLDALDTEAKRRGKAWLRGKGMSRYLTAAQSPV